MLFKIGVRKIFANFTEKHLCWSPFSIKLQALRLQECFLAKSAKFLRTSFFKEHLRWLPPYILYTHDVTCNLSRWNSGYNGINTEYWPEHSFKTNNSVTLIYFHKNRSHYIAVVEIKLLSFKFIKISNKYMAIKLFWKLWSLNHRANSWLI